MWLGVVAQLGCASRPHYGADRVVLSLPTATERAHLGEWITTDQRRGRTGRLSGSSGATTADALSLEAQQAVWSTTARWSRGAELDLWVPSDAGPVPVTLIRDERANIEVLEGVAARAPAVRVVATPDERDELATRLGIAGFDDIDARWTVEELTTVGIAIGAMPDADRVVLSGLRFERHADRGRSLLAYYDPQSEPPTIRVYDRAFDPCCFVGAPDAPLPGAALTVLHEAAHALADWPLRQLWRRYIEASRSESEDRRVRRREYRRASDGPVVAAWRVVRAGPGPSSYGARSTHESFAEAYALARLDPVALDRALPGARAWFDSGGATAAAGLSPTAAGR